MIQRIDEFAGLRTRREVFHIRHKERIKRYPITMARKAIELGLYPSIKSFMWSIGGRNRTK